MATQKWARILIISLVTVGIALTVTTLAALTTSQAVPLNGTITAINLGVYTDSGCTQNCTSLSIGNINPGSITTQTVYVKNTGNAPETLTMAVTNWSPPNASTYLTLNWNQQNTVLTAGQSVQATLTLTAASNTGTLTNFSCSVTFTGTQ
jgi:hypothetical protein